MFKSKVIAILALIVLAAISQLPATWVTASACVVLTLVFSVAIWPLTLNYLDDLFDTVLR